MEKTANSCLLFPPVSAVGLWSTTIRPLIASPPAMKSNWKASRGSSTLSLLPMTLWSARFCDFFVHINLFSKHNMTFAVTAQSVLNSQEHPVFFAAGQDSGQRVRHWCHPGHPDVLHTLSQLLGHYCAESGKQAVLWQERQLWFRWGFEFIVLVSPQILKGNFMKQQPCPWAVR